MMISRDKIMTDDYASVLSDPTVQGVILAMPRLDTTEPLRTECAHFVAYVHPFAPDLNTKPLFFRS